MNIVSKVLSGLAGFTCVAHGIALMIEPKFDGGTTMVLFGLGVLLMLQGMIVKEDA